VRWSLLVSLLAATLVVGCSSTASPAGPAAPPGSTGSTGSSAPAGNDDRRRVGVGYPTDRDVLSPLVVTALAPDPIPVTGTDGKVHVAYELEVLNFSPRVATLTQLETLAGGPDGNVVAAVDAADLATRTAVVMDPARKPNPSIPVGGTGLIVVDDVYDRLADVPASFTHRLHATFAPLTPDYEWAAPLWPAEPVSAIGGPVTTSTKKPVVIGPPLAGADWLATNACCDYNNHRNVLLPVAGRINGAERFGIDWVRWDQSDARELLAQGMLPTFRGDPAKNEDYLAYGQPLLAVADGTVVTVASGTPDSKPGALPQGIGLADLGGNLVIIDIGRGVYASYLHLAPGSPAVQVGDRVTRGQVIGRLGNAGMSSEAHLHFQLQSTPAVFPGDNLPFEIDTLTYRGSIDTTVGLTPDPDAGPRTNQLPLQLSIVDFPPANS
jgi:hypothetical protein